MLKIHNKKSASSSKVWFKQANLKWAAAHLKTWNNTKKQMISQAVEPNEVSKTRCIVVLTQQNQVLGSQYWIKFFRIETDEG